MPRSQFDILHVTTDIVFIRDRNLGHISVTNDAEDVCRFLHKHYPNLRIVYQDSEGHWDELSHSAGIFNWFTPWSGDVPE